MASFIYIVEGAVHIVPNISAGEAVRLSKGFSMSDCIATLDDMPSVFVDDMQVWPPIRSSNQGDTE